MIVSRLQNCVVLYGIGSLMSWQKHWLAKEQFGNMNQFQKILLAKGLVDAETGS